MLRARAAEGEAVASRDAADLARREAEAVAEFSSEMLKGVDPRTAEGRDTRLLRGLMDDALARIEAGSLADVPRAELRLRSTLGTVYAAISEFESALRTLQPAVALAEEVGADGPGSLAGILASIGRAHMRLSRLREAREWFGRALGVLDEVDEAGGDARLARANLHSDLSLLSEKEGDLEAAEQLCRRSVATKRELGGGEGTRLAATLGILGSILSRAGDLDGSAAAFDEALELARSYARSGDVVSLQVALGNSAYIHGILGDEQRAEQLHRESLKLGEQIFDGDHMFLAAAHAGLSASLSAQGRPLEALPHQQAAYEMCRRLFPAGHPELVRATCGLARQLSDLGRFREADELAAEAVRCAARLAPPDPSAELQALQVRGRVLGRLGKLEAAERVLREAVALDRSLQTETAGDVFYANSTADVLVNLATVLQRAEQVEERRALLREAVARYRETAPPTGSLELANALDNLGEALDGDEGERLLREALAMKRALFEGPHQDVATTALKLGRRLAARRDFAAAEPLLREAVRMRVEVLGADSIGTARARFDLAELMFGAGEDAERSAELVAGCLEVARAAQPADHHLIAAAGARYVEVLIQRGDLETALRVAREALAANREVESPPGVNVAIALVNLGVVHQRRGAAQQAIDCFVESGQLFEAEGVAPNQNAVPMFFLLARLHVSAGDEDAAIRSFERLFAMADRLGDAPAPMRVQAASELLEIQRRRGQHADALRAAQRLVAAADAVYADPSVARRPFVRSMARTEVVAEQLALAATRESVEERLRLLDAAETTAREVLAIREPMRTQDGYAWMLVDGSSLLGEVLLARAIALRHQDPAAAAGALEEARRRIPEAAEALWADTWKPGHRPPTAPQAARRMVVLLRHLAELEPEDGHAAQIDVWQQRASR
jgi:tetratricopeptide (TPR) repeat protein